MKREIFVFVQYRKLQAYAHSEIPSFKAQSCHVSNAEGSLNVLVFVHWEFQVFDPITSFVEFQRINQCGLIV